MQTSYKCYETQDSKKYCIISTDNDNYVTDSKSIARLVILLLSELLVKGES